MPAFYSWLKSNKEETKAHISEGYTTLCGHDIPARHTFNLFGGMDICIRCQKAYVNMVKEKRGDEWKECINSMFVPDIESDIK